MMRALVPVSVLSLYLLLGVSCSKDFEAFTFGDDAPEPAEDGGAPSRDGAVDAAAADVGAADAAEADATPPASDAAIDSGNVDSGERGDDASAIEAGSASDAELARDSGDAAMSPEDAAADTAAAADAVTDAPSDAAQDASADAPQDAGGTGSDASGLDAGSFDEAACRTELGSIVPAGKDNCDDCGCAQCHAELASCLDSGDEGEDALCSAVLQCALENACQVWDCYCANVACTAGGSDPPDGDGPCVAEMNAAAGGHKAEVEAIWTTTDTAEPLVRALDAVSCTIGRHRRSSGGELTGSCETDCL